MAQTIQRWSLALGSCALLAASGSAQSSLTVPASANFTNTPVAVQAVNQGMITACQGVDDSAVIREGVTLARGNIVTIPFGQTCAVNASRIANLRIMKGGVLKINGSATVTISGVFEAGAYQVFAGTGSVVFAAGTVTSVNPTWFGDCAAELGAPLNKAIRSIAETGGRIELPSGTLKQTVSVNLTNIKNQAIEIAGSARATLINAQLSGVAFDCTGSQFLQLRNFTISGNGSTTPSVALLFARNSTHDSAGRNHLYNVETMGNFKVAALYNYASEEFRAYDCYFVNNEVGAPVVVLTSHNVSRVSSAYAQIDSGPQSTLEIHFVGGAINQYATSGNTDSLLISGAGAVSFSNFFFVNNARAFVHIDAASYSAVNLDFRNLTFDGNKTASYGFLVSGSKEIAYLKVDNVLDYGIKSSDRGGRMLFAGNGTSLSNLTMDGLYSPSGLQVETNSVNYSRLDLGAAGTLENHYSVSNSVLRVASNRLKLDRPDLSLKNAIFFIDTGTLGLTLPVYANNRAAVAAGLPVGSLYRTGGEPDQVCVVH
jgi:hypothetical protein